VFVLSLPRAGSTLLQRILAAHEGIATASEPWLLLPYLYTLRDEGALAEYGHKNMVGAVRDFCRQLPGGEQEYLREIRALALRLYRRAGATDAVYFLDKTPRYALIAEDVLQLFPEGKFIFLWRNPLAVLASMIRTRRGGNGRWSLGSFRTDLTRGVDGLVKAYQAHADKVLTVSYERLLAAPEEVLAEVMAYLDLPVDPQQLQGFQGVKLRGAKGDPTGTRAYARISREPLQKWRQVLANPLRKAWARQYLRWVGQERLAVMGYNLRGLLSDLNDVPLGLRFVLSDLLHLPSNELRSHLTTHLFHRGPKPPTEMERRKPADG
jgi:hypothetical protein